MHCAANHLVTLRVHSQFESHVHSLVKFGRWEFFQNFEGFLERVALGGIHHFQGFRYRLLDMLLCGACALKTSHCWVYS